MGLKEFFEDINEEVKVVQSADFEIEIIETSYVPNFDDPNITYDNLDTGKKKCKLLESCVLYVDIRGSAGVSASARPRTLAKMYSSFVRSMIACGRYYGGHVRNVIGDRVMVVFDAEDCFKKAVDTATLMNSVSEYILNKHIRAMDFKCGIGIDYGKMLITKSGAVRRGAEKEFYRSLVWLGKPANVASRLTDLANKTIEETVPIIRQGNYYPYTHQWHWSDISHQQFINNLEPTNSNHLIHKDDYFYTFIQTSESRKRSYKSILITAEVFEGLKKSHPKCDYIVDKLLKRQVMNVRDYDGEVYGGDMYFSVAKELKN